MSGDLGGLWVRTFAACYDGLDVLLVGCCVLWRGFGVSFVLFVVDLGRSGWTLGEAVCGLL